MKTVAGPVKSGVEVHPVPGGWGVFAAVSADMREMQWYEGTREAANQWASEYFEDTFPGIFAITGTAPYLKLAEVPRDA
ncbi:hypothetical protein [Novosphingobium sp. 9U]|uniref:hypothetical protein n=1 Tax=Novosphingobium sp. 9U TaxID=2653158 RepID=UPI0012F37F73|nr:hypothetical protein [Novosphingobium sp. 9U]VWX52972.1 hypothetical protein NOVOSPHI9U_420215 [Novosphingobium sp. 9U]